MQDVLERHEVPFGVAYSVADIFADPHVAARGDIETVDDPVLGPVRMQGVYPRFSRTPGASSAGRPASASHNGRSTAGCSVSPLRSGTCSGARV